MGNHVALAGLAIAAVLIAGAAPAAHGAATDSDGDGYCTGSASPGSPGCPQGGGDCDDSDPAINPGASELCNGLDDDCDTVVDDLGRLCIVEGQLGTCRTGEARCVQVGGEFTETCEQTVQPRPEICFNGEDDDCDGRTDTADSDCPGGPPPTAPQGEICDDCADNDADGLADLADPDCRSGFLVITRARLRTRHGRTSAKLVATAGPPPFSEPPPGGLLVALAGPDDGLLSCTRIAAKEIQRRGPGGRSWRAAVAKGSVKLRLRFQADGTIRLVVTLAGLALPQASPDEVTLSLQGDGAAFLGPVPLRRRRRALTFP